MEIIMPVNAITQISIKSPEKAYMQVNRQPNLFLFALQCLRNSSMENDFPKKLEIIHKHAGSQSIASN
jgi:hypothetical protein